MDMIRIKCKKTMNSEKRRGMRSKRNTVMVISIAQLDWVVQCLGDEALGVFMEHFQRGLTKKERLVLNVGGTIYRLRTWME
jgi:hypothetical protein